MDKHKLILIFDENSKIDGIEKYFIFNNEKDASSFLSSIDDILTFKLSPEESFFSFKTSYWQEQGYGYCYWAIDKS